jgi:adenylate cyclase
MEPQITFGSFRFEPASARLWENDAEVRLTRKAALVLAALLERPGAPVSKQDLFASVWRGTVVSDDALVTCVQELRRALRDDSKQPVYIETRHRLGYRFAAPVTGASTATEPAQAAPQKPRPEAKTIAVLPFADMSPERDQDYLCEGLAEELIDALTHIEGLRVVARTSSFQFRGNHDLSAVGQKLGVGSLLEGSVRKSGDRLRITVQLIDIATGFHKWSKKFDLSASDVFAVQDEIAATVATLLRGDAPNARELRGIHRQPTAIETYEWFLRGRQRMHNWGQQEFLEARSLYERAIGLDAGYAPAWAGLATVHALMFEWCGSKDEDLQAADRASRIAMELAPELADANLARGYTLSNQRQYTEARRHFEAATRINPNLFDAYYYYGRAAFAAGDIEKSIELWHRAAEVRREDFESPMFEAQAMRRLGRIEESRGKPRGRAPRRAAAGTQSVQLARPVAGLGRALQRRPDGARTGMGASRRGPQSRRHGGNHQWRAGACALRNESRSARPARAGLQQGLGQEGMDRQRSGLRPVARRAAVQGDGGEAAAVTQRYCRFSSAE